MNIRGEGGELLQWNIAFFIIEAIFFVIMMVWIGWFNDGIGITEDLYAKEIVHIINEADPGQTVAFDVTGLVKIADKENVGRSDIFTIDNVNNVITVKLSRKTGTSFKFFNDVDVVNWNLAIENSDEFSDVRFLNFEIKEAINDE